MKKMKQMNSFPDYLNFGRMSKAAKNEIIRLRQENKELSRQLDYTLTQTLIAQRATGKKFDFLNTIDVEAIARAATYMDKPKPNTHPYHCVVCGNKLTEDGVGRFTCHTCLTRFSPANELEEYSLTWKY